MWRNSLIGALLAYLTFSGPVIANQGRHFAIIWAYQNQFNRPVKSHTFATFFSVDRGQLVENETISWLPAPGYFAGISGLEMPPIRVVPGRNYSLKETLRFAEALNEPVVRFGPYEVEARAMDQFRQQVFHLESGLVNYKMLDRFTRPRAINCIHAVSDAFAHAETAALHGNAASAFIVRVLNEVRLLRSGVPDEAIFQSVKNSLLTN